MRILSTSTIILSSVMLFSACSTVKLDEKPPVEERTGTAPVTTTGTDPRTVSTITTTSQSGDPLNDPQGILAKRSIYFDLDSYIVRDEFRPVIEAHARYLTSNRARRIAIQGHTDERGGSEYNLALGQKRAEAVRKSLALLGVTEAQMEAVSFGKEKPKALSGDEPAWAENRRADITY